jgi:ABC-type Fe3+-hydroxamate transport system substrate-binding protein
VRRAALLAAVVLGALAPAAEAAPKRIVALNPFSANTVADLGVRPVAIGQIPSGDIFCSPRLRGVRRLPLSHPSGPNLEQLATLNPGLVLSSPAWSRGHRAMRRLGMKVAETEPRSVHATGAMIKRIGELIGKKAAAKRMADRNAADVAAATRGIRKRPRVLVILGIGRVPYAFLANSWGGDIVSRAGGRLLTDGLRAGDGFARISNETVVKRNPDIIIAVPHGSPKDMPKLAAYLRSNPAWRSTKAARKGRVYVSTGNSLLQPWTDVGRTIRDIRTKYLHN